MERNNLKYKERKKVKWENMERNNLKYKETKKVKWENNEKMERNN